MPTLEKLQQSILEDMDLLFSLHEKERCSNDCLFCVQEALLEDSPLEVIVDDLLESHLVHRKNWLYPFSGCQYCQEEQWLIRNSEFKLTGEYSR